MKINFRQYRQLQKKSRNKSRGSALIAALSLLFIAGMLTAVILSLSRISTFDIRSHVELQRSAYTNEGVSNRILWLLAADRTVYPGSTRLGELDYTEYDHDRFAADGIPHIINYHGTEVQVVIEDAVSGYNLSGNNYRSQLQTIASSLELDDSEITDKTTEIIARITDYIDTNDNVSTDGMEAPEYEAEGLAPLPRNGTIRYREEFFFIPGIAELFPPDRFGRLSSIRLIPPVGMRIQGSNRPAFMTATPQMLKVIGRLEDEEVEEVIQARETWLKEKTPFSEQLDPLLLSRLQNRFSWNESGYFSIRIEAPEKSGRISRRLFFTCADSGVGGPTNEMLHYYEWLQL